MYTPRIRQIFRLGDDNRCIGRNATQARVSATAGAASNPVEICVARVVNRRALVRDSSSGEWSLIFVSNRHREGIRWYFTTKILIPCARIIYREALKNSFIKMIKKQGVNKIDMRTKSKWTTARVVLLMKIWCRSNCLTDDSLLTSSMDLLGD